MDGRAIGSALEAARSRAGLTQAEVAARMGTSQTAVSRAEAGRLPSWHWLQRYALALGRPIALWISVGDQQLTPPELPPATEDDAIARRRLAARRRHLQRAVRLMERETP